MLNKKLVLISATLMLVACSKSPVGGSGSAGTVIDSQFIDDPVKGLEVVADSALSSKTGTLGKFKCKKGEKVKFKLKGLELGEAVCGDKIFVDDLSSDEPSHSPEKVAAIIQSFAVPGSDELDLEAIEVPDLSAITFNTVNEAALQTLQDTVDYGTLTKPTVLDPADTTAIRALLDTAIAAYSSLTEAMKLALDDASVLPSVSYADRETQEKLIKITGKLTSRDPNDYCYDFMQGRVSVTKEVGATKPYKLEINRVAYFDALDAYNPSTNRCSNLGWCDDDTTDYVTLPAPRVIASNEISYLMVSNNDDYSSESKALITLDMVNGEAVISGSVSDKLTFTDDEDNEVVTTCNYSLTSEEVSIPSEGPASDPQNDEPDAPIAAVGIWSGEITTCSNPSEYDLRGVTEGALEITQDSSDPTDIYPTFVLSTTLHEVGNVVGYTQSSTNGSNYVVSQDYDNGRFEAVFAGPGNFTFNYFDPDGNSCGGSLSLDPDYWD